MSEIILGGFFYLAGFALFYFSFLKISRARIFYEDNLKKYNSRKNAGIFLAILAIVFEIFGTVIAGETIDNGLSYLIDIEGPVYFLAFCNYLYY